MPKNGMRPVHPGEILKEEYIDPMGITPASLARTLKVSAPTVNEIVRQRRGITADMALRLSAALGTTAQFWLNLQTAYDLRRAEIDTGEQIALEVHAIVHCA